jgi:hypothetical protein
MFSIYLLQDLWQECNIIDYKNCVKLHLAFIVNWQEEENKVDKTESNKARRKLNKTCKKTTMEQDIAWDQSYKTSQHKCTWKRIIEKSLQKNMR